MNYETAKILENVQSPSIMDLLEIHGFQKQARNLGGYDSYSINAHNSDESNRIGEGEKEAEFEQFCKVLYIRWRKERLANDNPKSDGYQKLKACSPEFIESKGFKYSDILKQSEVLFPGLEHVAWDQNLSNDFFHVETGYATGVPFEKYDARLYINFKTENIIPFCKLFIKAVSREGLFGYFKFSYMDERNDSWLLYCSYENLPKYLEIIENIKKERPELFEGTEKISPNLGKVNDYIGYGDEPKGSTKRSHNSRLDKVVNDTYDEVMEEFFKIVKPSDVENMRSGGYESLSQQQKAFFDEIGVQTEEYLKKLTGQYPNEPILKEIYEMVKESSPKGKTVFPLVITWLERYDRVSKENWLLLCSSICIEYKGRKLSLNGKINFFKAFRATVGEEKVREIAEKHCKENNVDIENTCFNADTKQLITDAKNKEAVL